MAVVRLVFAQCPVGTGTTVRALDAEEVDALECHFRDGVDATWLPQWLARMARLRLWIACDCRAPSDRAPMLFVRARARGAHVLVRMPDAPPHAPRCVFSGAPALAAARDESPVSSDLLELLIRWFSAARLNVLYPYEGADAISVQYAALREVSKSLALAPGRSLYEFSRTHPLGLPELSRRIAGSAANAPSSTGIFLAVTATLDPQDIRAALHAESPREWTTLDPLTTVERPVRTEEATGPFLLLLELTAAQGGSTVAKRVLAQPVHSERLLVPLDGAQDRRTLDVLLDVQRTMLVAHRRVVTIRRTLPDTSVCERGIHFQLQRLGPNGRAVQSVDVGSADAALAQHEGVDVERAEGMLYHAVGPTAGPLTHSDHSFKRRLLMRLLSPLTGLQTSTPSRRLVGGRSA